MLHLAARARSAALLLMFALALVLTPVLPTTAAEPGATLLSFLGALSGTVPSRTLPLTSGGPANLRLAVSGGAPTDTLTLTVLDASNTERESWIAYSGETIWGYADLPDGARLRLTTSGVTLNVALTVYARGTLGNPTETDTEWSGTARGVGLDSTNSMIQLVAPSAGLYRFTLGAAQGSYQLVVDDDHVRKTVVSGNPLDPDDTIYFLTAGVHTFQIIQHPDVAITEWSVAFSPAGSTDQLPYSETAPELGDVFPEEWVPIQIPAAQPVNVRIAVNGAESDRLEVALFNGNTQVFTSTAVAGEEIVWGSAELSAGANRLRITTQDGNSAPLAYTVTLAALPEPELEWSGFSYGVSPDNSQIRVRFTRAGLYRFDLQANAGRYQLRLNNTALQKIVTSDGATFNAYVPTGTHTLVLDQDSRTDTRWAVTITPLEATSDTLPFRSTGTTLGGSANDFTQEWLPIRSETRQRVNIRVTATDGNTSDALRVQLFRSGSSTALYNAANVFSSEIFWATTDLVTGTNLLRISALGGNEAALSYQVEISPVSDIPTSWSGVALGDGLHSALTINAPEEGIYTVVVTLTTGAGQLLVESPDLPVAPSIAQVPQQSADSVIRLRVPLTEGFHRFVFAQDAEQPRTEWSVNAQLLRSAIPLTISEVRPGFVERGVAALVEVTGTGFESGSAVKLIDSGGQALELAPAIISGTELTVTLPSDLADGVYTLEVTNPDGSQVRQAAAVSVGVNTVYLPMLMR